LNGRLRIGERELSVDLSRPVSIARELDFQAPHPRHFGVPAATARPYAVPGFAGSVAAGASCNCSIITLIPHCNGTHTECVGHLTRERLDAHRVAPVGLLPALLISVAPVAARTTSETTEPAPRAEDTLITRQAMERAWPRALPFAPSALIVRTLQGVSTAPDAHTDPRPPPYLTQQAAQFMVERAIEHLVIDLPSIDREHDEGRLTAHRVFFGLPRGSTALADSGRPHATVTELASISADVPDGPWLLQLQVPALSGDAVPSRPLLYRPLTE
jgi:kynurenine formamidase